MSSQYSAYPGAGSYPVYPSSANDAAGLKGIDPIIARLRPRDVVGIIDQAFRIYRGHFLTFLAIIAVVEVPLQGLMQIANVLLIGSTVSPLSPDYYRLQTSPSSINERFTNQLIYLGVVSGLAILYQVFSSFAQAALTSSVADNYLDRPVSFTGAYKHVFRRAGPVIGLMLLDLLIIIAAFIPTILVLAITVAALAGGSGSSGGATALVCLAFPLIFIGFGFLLYAFVRLQAALPALMVENLGPAQAIRRSWQLLDGYWWRTAGLLLIVYILDLIVSSGPAALISSVMLLFVRLDPVLSEAITGAVTVLTTAIFIPVQLTAYTLYYFDIRVRREGLDLEAAIAEAYPNPFPHGQAPYYPAQGQGQQQSQPYPAYGYGVQAQQGQFAAPGYTMSGTTGNSEQMPMPDLGRYGENGDSPPAEEDDSSGGYEAEDASRADGIPDGAGEEPQG